MSVGGLIGGLILLTIFLLVIALPLLNRSESASPDAELIDKQRERLNIYYERVLRNIRDLDEDHALGKINPQTYAADRERWSSRGIEALKALDQLDAPEGETPRMIRVSARRVDDAALDRAINDAIEAAVAQARREVEHDVVT